MEGLEITIKEALNKAKSQESVKVSESSRKHLYKIDSENTDFGWSLLAARDAKGLVSALETARLIEPETEFLII